MTGKFTRIESRHKALLAAMISGKARWEFYSGSKSKGEVCVNGLRYSAELDNEGIPIVSMVIYNALLEVFGK